MRGLHILKIVFAIGILLLPGKSLYSNHLMGGEITWQCIGGGQFVFNLTIYRDCNGPGFTTTGVNLRVWNHPTLTSIPMNFVSQNDISPVCTAVAGGPSQITCGTGGTGAVERYFFQSAPISIAGVPPAQGWAFTYDNFSRNVAIDNLVTPNLYGLTLRAIMYNYSGFSTDPCFDSSPTFLESPLNLFCSSTGIQYNNHASDVDGDSLVFDFAPALDQISTTAPVFNPPVSPIEIPYNPGYSYLSPTPGTSFDPGNIPATINPQTGEITLTSNTLGSFVVVVRVKAYRCNQLIAEVYREIQVAITTCSGNNLPIITPPFGTGYSTTVYAGEMVSFSVTATDTDLLQDGSPQSVTLSATGSEFGAGFTNPLTGCDNPPCAILNSGLPATNVTSITRNFTWQTNCSHLPTVTCGQEGKLYQFVFKAADDFCPAPGVNSITVSVKVLPPPPMSPAQITCADVALNGDVTLSWTPPVDTYGNFNRYEIINAASGSVITAIPTLATNSYTHVGADAQNASMAYVIRTISGCGGTDTSVSDTVTTMFIDVVNSGTGLAYISWNELFEPVNSPTSLPFYTIWREYPLGTWTAIGTRPYGITSFTDTISICDDTLNYKVSIADSSGCTSFSSIRGDRFTDLTEPYTPLIAFVTVDTLTGTSVIEWLPNGAADTEGYIILQNTGSGWIIIDTVMGINNTTYVPAGSDPFSISESYGVAAFDSCWHGTPPTPNTSPMSVPHNTIYLTTVLSVCDSSIRLNWNPYVGWTFGVNAYEVYASENNGPYLLIASLSGSITSYTHSNLNRGSTYEYIIRAKANVDVYTSLSNISSKTVKPTDTPAYTYLKSVSVTSNSSVDIRFMTDASATVLEHIIYRSDDGGSSYNPIATLSGGLANYTHTDADVAAGTQSYTYYVMTIDSCGKPIISSNIGRTIYLQTFANSLNLVNNLNWNNYIDWNGSVQNYTIERSVNSENSFTAIGTNWPSSLYYNDDVSLLIETTGEFCYRIKANENTNSFGITEESYSNISCTTQDPLVYIPNAFTPGGANPVFLPVVSYVDFNNYSLDIFNRWGQLLFNSTDTNVGWDGTHNNKLCKEDVYVYIVRFTTGDGQLMEKRGFVTLIDYK